MYREGSTKRQLDASPRGSTVDMGIPFSRQINAAFDQVTPLVGQAYEVLETTKNIALILLFLQIYIAVILTFSLLALVSLLITTNPDLEKERRTLVTPALKWLSSWMITKSGRRKSIWGLVVALFVVVGLAFGLYVYYVRNVIDATSYEDEDEADTGEGVDSSKGKDVDALKKGESTQ